MSFTKVLLTIFLIVIVSTNVEAINEIKLSCRAKCRLSCALSKTPGCYEKCIQQCHISLEKLNCNLACSTERCSKFKKGIVCFVF